MLHITNGDAARYVLDKLVRGEILPWRDVLHEGPVDAALTLEELSRVRAAFIASAGWGPAHEVQRQFAERDATLKRCGAHEEVVLWFEHDLFDQLQLIQLLDWFNTHPHAALSLVCEAEYLGALRPERAVALFAARRRVSPRQLAQGSAAWRAFGSPGPQALSLAPQSELPFLAAALRRLLEEYPWTSDGLSRLERQVLVALSHGALDLRTLYRRAHREQEKPVWLGDTVFAWHLARLAGDLFVVERDGNWQLTQTAERVLGGKADAWSQPRAPRWVGGFEVVNGSLRWDAASGRLVGFPQEIPRAG